MTARLWDFWVLITLMGDLKLFRIWFSNSILFCVAVFLVMSNLRQWDQIYYTHTEVFRKDCRLFLLYLLLVFNVHNTGSQISKDEQVLLKCRSLSLCLYVSVKWMWRYVIGKLTLEQNHLHSEFHILGVFSNHSGIQTSQFRNW